MTSFKALKATGLVLPVEFDTRPQMRIIPFPESLNI
jgi:hypothetical protein